MIKNQEPETPPSPLHLPPPPPWSSERAMCELARSSVLGIFIMIIVTIIKHGDYFKHCFLYDQDVCMYLHIVTKQGKDPSTKRKGKRQRRHSGLKVVKVSDTLLKQPTSPREVTSKNVCFLMWTLTIVHFSLSSPQPTSASGLGDNSVLHI